MKQTSIQELPISFTTSASYDLGLLISNWLTARPQRSQRLLASRTQVGLASINRLVAPFLGNEDERNSDIQVPEDSAKQTSKVKKLRDTSAENKGIGLDLVLKLLPEITNYSGM
ncbi:MAG: hypothetical protein KBD78_16845, partial [Oligoflexales bacterium]|nr:hypothetical protein [Oligoflexales bacterium]